MLLLKNENNLSAKMLRFTLIYPHNFNAAPSPGSDPTIKQAKFLKNEVKITYANIFLLSLSDLKG
jgi:hypothetical protein